MHGDYDVCDGNAAAPSDDDDDYLMISTMMTKYENLDFDTQPPLDD